MNDLPKERLATTDETGRRVYLYPAPVSGFFRKRRSLFQAFLILFFLALPWAEWNGRQLVLLDVARREFFLFGLHFRAHDAPLILFLLLTFTFLIGLVTAVFGRVWCGWACPQSVFIEGVYRRLETWIEGSHRERRALDQAPPSFHKYSLKAAKWGAFLLATLVITHSFLAYFVGSRELLGFIARPPAENWASFLVIVFTTALILFDFGWFREQFCVIMCPYGRFQSVLLDSHSTVVAYDQARGEPRRGAVAPGEKQGDCVNCYRCVQVCPTGIDIRRGLQMECIACTACIDACDEVMGKISKPAGLIRYTTNAELAGRPRKILRPRVLAYSGLLLLAAAGLVFSLGTKDFFEVALLRAKESPYQLIQQEGGEWVVNHFRLDVSNQTGAEQTLEVIAPEAPVTLVMPLNRSKIPDDGHLRLDFFLRFPADFLENGSRPFKIRVRHGAGERELEATLVGPVR